MATGAARSERSSVKYDCFESTGELPRIVKVGGARFKCGAAARNFGFECFHGNGPRTATREGRLQRAK